MAFPLSNAGNDLTHSTLMFAALDDPPPLLDFDLVMGSERVRKGAASKKPIAPIWEMKFTFFTT